LSPPSASEPAKPVQLASTEVIKTVTLSTANRPLGDGNKTDEPLSSEPKSQSGSTTTTENTGKQNVPAKKTYCN
jgi:hypothetical protein